MSKQKVEIRVQATPNPAAWKFVLDCPVLLEGKATYSTEKEAAGNQLVKDLFAIDGVNQVHLFQNVITVSHRFDSDTDEIQDQVSAVIKKRIPTHDPKVGVQESVIESRKSLPEDIQKIEAILDRTIRPGLQGDGGDIEIVKYEDNQLFVSYQGACGTCPSSTTGTLMAIEGILRDEFNPTIEIIPV